MKIFLDVGAYNGDTARAVLNHGYNFDKIYCFEPIPHFCDQIRQNLKNEKIVVNEFGLWKDNCVKRIYNINSIGASIFKDDSPLESADIKLVKASEWFKENIKKDDEVFLKLNCEGSECDIVEDIIDASEDHKIKALMIDFDVRKIESQKHREAEVMKKINKTNIEAVIVVEKEDGRRFRKNHSGWTHHWIDKALNLIKKNNG